jgi:hypothetical protein
MLFFIQIEFLTNASTAILITKKKHAKSKVGQHSPPTKAKVGSGIMEE